MSNNLHLLDYKKEEEILYLTWKAETKGASWKELKCALDDYTAFMQIKKPKGILVNEQNLMKPWTPERQEYINLEIAPKFLEAGVKYFAIVVSKDIFVQISVEQVMEEKNSAKFQNKFFDDKQKAKEWLVKQIKN